MRPRARVLAGGLALAVAACITPDDGSSEQGDAALRLFELAKPGTKVFEPLLALG